jgi:arylsulfatase A-like enzyme
MPLPEDETLIPSDLADAGYATGHMHKTHYGEFGERQFDWYSADLADFPRFLEQTAGRPFFLWVGFTDPHRPYRDEPIRRRIAPGSVDVPAHLVDSDETRSDLADYHDEIARMDSVIGAYLDELEKRNLRGNTLVFFLSDNGAPFPRAKGTLYDAGIRTPLIVSWPGHVSKDVRTDALVSTVDLVPTVLELAGAPLSDNLQGSSFHQLLVGGGQTVIRRFAFSERNWHNCDEHMRSVTTRRFKLIQNAYLDEPHCTPADISRSPSWQVLAARLASDSLSAAQRDLFRVPRPEYELYDLERDPHEYRNLAADPEHAGVLDQMIRVLEQWKDETGDFPPDRRRRGDNTDRRTGIKFTQSIPEMIE